MATQYDYQPGLDLSGQASVSQSELMQAISQINPLANIGGIIYQAATTANNNLTPGSNGAPDVPGNARFLRYIWLNSFTKPPTKYTYNTDTDKWDFDTVGDSSIHSGKLATHASSVAILHMLKNAAGVVPTDATIASKVGVMDSSGQYFGLVTRADFMTGFSLATASISSAGGASPPGASFIRYNGGTPAWGAFVPATDIVDGALPLAKLASGTANYLLRAGAAGVPEYVNRDDAAGNWLPAGTTSVGIPISKLKFSGTLFAQIRTNSAGTALEQAVDPEFYASSDNALSAFTAGTPLAFAHGLTGTPDVVHVWISLTTPGGYGWTAGNLISHQALMVNGTDEPAIVWSAGSTNVNILFRPEGGSGYDLVGNNGVVTAATKAVLNATNGLKVHIRALKYNRA